MSDESPYQHVAELKDRELIDKIRAGDDTAERVLFDRYYVRLVEYARRRMNVRLRQVEPPSDVAQSALKSVFLGIPTREFDLSSNKSLWPLLVTVTLNKIRNRGKKHFGVKRDLSRNIRADDYGVLIDDRCSQSEAELYDLVSELLSKFSGRRRRIIELVLQDYGVGEIARELEISERTVYNTRQRAAASLLELLDSEKTC
jgi:RNA polymerase sigma factor (sigma-70 family)